MEAKRVLIIDDEQIARDRIIRFLGQQSLVLDVRQAVNALEALDMIPDFLPQVIFLDIQMPGLNGFEFLQQVENKNFQVIFQTAHDEFALKAFEASACDYLLKPFTLERLTAALHRALNAQDQKEELLRLQNSLEHKKYLEKITFKQGGKLRVLDLIDVFCFVSRDHCTLLHTKSTEHIVDFSLTYLEENLNPQKFVRCHRNAVVSIDKIKSMGPSSESELELTSGMKVQVSRSQRSVLIEKLSN